MALPRITDITRQIDHEIQIILDQIEGVLAPGGGSGLGDPGGNGMVVRTALGITTARTITGTSNQIFVVNGDGVSGNPTLSIPSNSQLSIAKITNLTGNGFVKTSGGDGSLSIDTATYLNAANNLSDLVSTSTARSNLGVAIGSNVQAWDADLDAIAALAGTSGLPRKTAANTWALDTATYATQAYADALVVGLLDDRGNFDASGNLFPSSGGSGTAGAILKGDLWTISVAGTLGGHPVTAGDVVRALTDTPGQTDANWAIGENNFGYVALNQALADGKIYVGNASGIGTAVTPSGDVTISNAGVTAIGALKVTNGMLAGSIAASKLVGTDIATVGTITAGTWQGTVIGSAYGGTGINNGGRTLTINTNSGTLAFGAASKTLTINNSIALSGTDSTVMTFPSTSATVARTDAAQTFTGNQTFANHILPSLPDTSDVGAELTPFRKGYISELNATLFAQNTISVIGGWLIVTKDEGTVDEDVDTSETQIDFGTNNIAANDFIVFRSAGAVEYMQATSLVSGTTWNVTRNVDGSGANAWPQGSVWVNFGYNGTGRIELNANSTPRMSMLTQGTSYNAQTELLRIGDLNGWSDYASAIYGFATGNPSAANITIDATNGLRIRHGTTNKIVLDASGNASFTGSITAAAGTVAGWTINSTYLNSGAVYVASGFDIPAGAHAWFGKSATGYYGVNLADASGRLVEMTANNSTIYPYFSTYDGTRFRVVIGGLNFAFGSDGSTNSMGMKIWDSAGTKLVEFSDVQNIISGFTIGSDYIRDNANSFGLASTVTGGDDVRFWAGDTFANRATAVFRVTEAGALTATNATLTGSLTAGNGNVLINSNGIGISYTGTQTLDSIRWLTSGTIFAQLYGDASGASATWRALATATASTGQANAGLQTSITGVTQVLNFELENAGSSGGNISRAMLGGHSGFQGLRIDNNDWSLVSSGPSRLLDLRYREGTTNTFYDMIWLSKNSTGTPAADYGASLLFRLESSTTEDQDAARVGALWTTATHASRTSAFVIQTVNSAGSLAEVARFAGNGDAIFTGLLKAGSGPTTLTDSTGKILLTSAVTGTLPVANGGTGDTGTAWTSYTPSIAAGSGSFTTVSAEIRYKTIGKLCFIFGTVTVTNIGTAGGYIRLTLPVSPKATIVQSGGARNESTSKTCTLGITGDGANLYAYIHLYDGTFPAASGQTVDFNTVIELA